MQRLRSRNVVLPGCFYTANGREVYPPADDVRVTESIIDEVGYPKTRPPQVTSVVHTKNEGGVLAGGSEFRVRFRYPPYNWMGPYRVSFKTPAYANPISLSYLNGLVDWASLVVRLADQVNGLVQTKSQLAVTFAEMRKTWKMVRNPFSLLRRDWRLVAGKSPISRLAKRGANIWLEGQYGWRPLYKDMLNFCDSAAKWSITANRYSSTGGSRRLGNRAQEVGTCPSPSISDSTWSSYLSYYAMVPWSYANQPYLTRCIYDAPVIKAAVGCRAADSITNHNSRLRRHLSYFGVDPGRDLLPTLWELIPFSFVVDWFVNSQGLFDQLRYDSALGVLGQTGVTGLCYSTKIEYTYRFQAIPVFDWYAYNISSWDFAVCDQVQPHTNSCITSSTSKYSIYTRVAGIPPNEIQTLWNKGLSLSQIASGLALLIQRWK